MALFQLRGSLRIGNGLGIGPANQAGFAEGRPPYTESLVKLFPAEGVGLTTLAVCLCADKVVLNIIRRHSCSDGSRTSGADIPPRHDPGMTAGECSQCSQ